MKNRSILLLLLYATAVPSHADASFYNLIGQFFQSKSSKYMAIGFVGLGLLGIVWWFKTKNYNTQVKSRPAPKEQAETFQIEDVVKIIEGGPEHLVGKLGIITDINPEIDNAPIRYTLATLSMAGYTNSMLKNEKLFIKKIELQQAAPENLQKFQEIIIKQNPVDKNVDARLLLGKFMAFEEDGNITALCFSKLNIKNKYYTFSPEKVFIEKPALQSTN